jgi:hypothetical protein
MTFIGASFPRLTMQKHRQATVMPNTQLRQIPAAMPVWKAIPDDVACRSAADMSKRGPNAAKEWRVP